jgi:hypothetical protein
MFSRIEGLMRVVVGLFLCFTACAAMAGENQSIDQPPTPSRQPENCNTPGVVCAKIRPGELAAAYVYSPCQDHQGNKYREPYTNQIGWIWPENGAPPGVSLSHTPEQLISWETDTEYFSTTKKTPLGSYRVYYISSESEHCDGYYFNFYVDVVPDISSDLIDSGLWYFGGNIKPNGWQTSTILKTTAVATEYIWRIAPGSQAAKFSNGGTSIVTQVPRVKVISIAPSAQEREVLVSVSIVKDGYELTSDYLKLDVRSPASMAPRQITDWDDSGYGYKSVICYRILDQMGKELPVRLIPVNEKFITDLVVDYKESNWRRGNEGGATQYANNSCDEIEGEAPAMLPQPRTPQNPLTDIKINHWKGNWSVGSETPGQGTVVRRGIVWRKYIDHARHQ